MRLRYIFLILYSLFFGMITYADQPKNLVYVIVDGTSQNTFYALLNKGRLPHFQELSNKGNYRNLGGDFIGLNSTESYLALFTGYDRSDKVLVTSNYVLESSFFPILKDEIPSLNMAFFLTEPINDTYSNLVTFHLTELIDWSQSDPLQYLTSHQIGRNVSTYLKNVQEPFFITLNFTNVDFVARRYREGAQLYSQAIINCDKALGQIIKYLKENKLYDRTEFLITTTYGFEPNDYRASSNRWVLSTQKIMRKGTLLDIVPTIYDFYHINDLNLVGDYSGKSLFLP